MFQRLTRWFGFALVFVSCAALGTWGAGRYLVVDDAPVGWGTHLLLLDAPAPVEVALSFRAQQAGGRVLLLRKSPGRAMQLGALPEYHDFMRDQFLAAGMREDDWEVLAGAVSSKRSSARVIASWMKEHPDARVVAAVDRLSGRAWQQVFNEEPALAGRVRFRGVSRAQVNEMNWWRSQAGVIAVVKQYASLCRGRDDREAR